MRKDSVQKQWDTAAETWADFVRTRKDYFRDEMNNPAMLELLGDIRGKRILDLGCGEGDNSRIMVRKGAKVTGVDFSKKMIDFAIQQEKNEGFGIDYRVLDASNLHTFKDNMFDIVACFMALQDIEDYQDAIKEASRVLKKRGRFAFAIPHPCFEVRSIGDKVVGGWEYSKGTKDKSTGKAIYYKVDRYFGTRRDIVPWNMERLTKHFKTTAFHRTLTDYADALYNAGFIISRLKEPMPTKRGLAKYPILKLCLRIPHSIVIEAMKC